MVQTLITCPYIEEYIHDPDYIDSPNDRDDSVLLFESTESDVMESIYASKYYGRSTVLAFFVIFLNVMLCIRRPKRNE